MKKWFSYKNKVISVVLALALLLNFIPIYIPATAAESQPMVDEFLVKYVSTTNYVSTFEIRRVNNSGIDKNTKVYYRTINGSAMGGTHFIHTDGFVTFDKNEQTKTFTVTEFESSNILKYASRYQNNARSYEVEIYSAATPPTRARRWFELDGYYTINPKMFTSEAYAYNRSGSITHGDVSSDGLGWTKDKYFGHTDTFQVDEARKGYLQEAGITSSDQWLRLSLSAKEKNDGFQSLQVKFSTYDDKNPNGYKVPNEGSWSTYNSGDIVSTTLPTYYAMTELTKSVGTQYDNITFPENAAIDGVTHDTGYDLNINSTRSFDGKKYFSPADNSNSLYSYAHVAYNASGSSNDKWESSNLYAYVHINDTTAPVVRSVSPMGTVQKGDKVNISVAYNEIVNVTGQPTLKTELNDEFKYVDGSGTNVLVFEGSIPITFPRTSCYVNYITNGTIKDLAGNDANKNVYKYSDVNLINRNVVYVSGDGDDNTSEYRGSYEFPLKTLNMANVYTSEGSVMAIKSGPVICGGGYFEIKKKTEIVGNGNMPEIKVPAGVLTSKEVSIENVKLTYTGTGERAAVIVSSGIFNMYNGIIIGGKNAGVEIKTNADTKNIFNMYGGSITGNSSAQNGGGVYNGDTFNMYGGSITGNSSTKYGGGVYNGNTFNMYGGSITSNSSAQNGGGVYNGNTFNMYGGSITSNTSAQNGGGVYNYGSVAFNISSGSITGNTAGVNGGGVYDGKMCFSGTVNITGNKLSNNSKENIYLNNLSFNINSSLNSASTIGVTMSRITTPIYDGTASYSNSSFVPDKEDEEVYKNGNKLYLQKLPVKLPNSFSISTNNSKTLYVGDTATLTATANPETIVGNKFTYQWYCGDTALTGQTNKTLILTGNVSTQGSYNYYCKLKATNSDGKTDSVNSNTIQITFNNTASWDTVADSATANIDYTYVKYNELLIHTVRGFVWFARSVNRGGRFDNCKITLQNDIDLKDAYVTGYGTNMTNENSWQAIGSSRDKYFAGTFEGDGHKIKNVFIGSADNMISTSSYQGLFGFIDRATIRNISVDVAIYCQGTNLSVGGLVGFLNQNASVESCNVSGIIKTGDNAITGGLAGTNLFGSIARGSSTATIISGNNSKSGGLVGVNNKFVLGSYSTGSVTGGDKAFVGGLIGENSYGKLDNSYASGVVSQHGTYSDRVGGVMGENRSTDVTKCYYNSQNEKGIGYNNTNVVGGNGNAAEVVNLMIPKTLEQFASGEVAYQLNNSTSEGWLNWGQNLNNGKTPQLTPEFFSGIVYYISDTVPYYSNIKNCTHNFNINGFCTNCKTNQPANLNNGYYEISNLGKLLWFNGLTKTKPDASARLTNNIDMSGIVWQPIGSNEKPYTGTFDGGVFKITNFKMDYVYENAAFFGVIGENATIKNMNITGQIKTIRMGAAGLVGKIIGYNVLIDRCITDVDINVAKEGDATSGGIVGRIEDPNASGTIKILNCAALGNITSEDYSITCVAGFVGWNGVGTELTIENSYSLITTSASEGSENFARNGAKILNSYYKDQIGTSKQGTKKTANQFASGEVAFLLNGSTSEGDLAWGQNIDNGAAVQSTPVLGSANVYLIFGINDYFTNKTELAECTHSFDGSGTCSICKAVEPASLENGYYIIPNLGKLVWFSRLTQTEPSANAKLVADIDMKDVTWNPIGSNEKPYTGTFDGGFYKITNLYLSVDYQYVSFFNIIGTNAIIKNMNLSGKIDSTTINIAGLVGKISGFNVLIDRCTTDVDIYTANGGSSPASGIVGTVENPSSSGTIKISNCVAFGDINNSRSDISGVGGIVAWNNAGTALTIENCLSLITTTYNGNNDNIVRNGATIINCYYEKSISYSIQGEQKTADQLASGEVAFLLNGSKSDGDLAWGQDLDNGKTPQLFPVIGGAVVYKTSSSYTNTEQGIISVEITWGEMAFTYTQGTWNKDTHTYDGSGWTADKSDGNKITVANKSDVDVNVSYSYSQTKNEIAGSFTDGTNNPITNPVALPVNDKKYAYLVLIGKPGETLSSAEIGTITITIGGV